MTIIRYSPKPIEAYGTVVRAQRVGAPDVGVPVGPHTSPLLANDPEAWNLAFRRLRERPGILGAYSTNAAGGRRHGGP